MARRPMALDLFRLPGVAPQHSWHVQAPTCTGLHQRFDSPRGKAHMSAAERPSAGGKTGVWARTARRTSPGKDY